MIPLGLELIAASPWIIAMVLIPLLLTRRSRVRRFARARGDTSPLVSVIVPARNEAENIGACVATLLNSEYARLEVIVVDDQSTDGTADIVRIMAARSGRLRLLSGEAPPAGWVGKNWACWQGYREARGELLLFTDADTRHDEALLAHCAGALMVERADLLSVLPRQRMLTFWERVILPQIFTAIILRYHDVERVSRATKARDAIANGQYMLFRREAYEALGGHEAVRAEVVEDMALAQRAVAAKRRLRLLHADDLMDTRMYRSLGGIMEGWTKNLASGSRRAVPSWIAPVLPWIAGLATLAIWVLPPVLLLLSLFTGTGDSVQGWALVVSVASALTWVSVNLIMRVPPQHAIVFPLGASMVALLFFRSALRGSRVSWRGRSYRLPAEAAPPPPPTEDLIQRTTEEAETERRAR